ncbi:hypothetical protein M8J77_007499 [Diaphorina citri]|nr:hypothetical protein M8J77_007499 [Diaphorina citri]
MDLSLLEGPCMGDNSNVPKSDEWLKAMTAASKLHHVHLKHQALHHQAPRSSVCLMDPKCSPSSTPHHSITPGPLNSNQDSKFSN